MLSARSTSSACRQKHSEMKKTTESNHTECILPMLTNCCVRSFPLRCTTLKQPINPVRHSGPTTITKSIPENRNEQPQNSRYTDFYASIKHMFQLCGIKTVLTLFNTCLQYKSEWKQNVHYNTS